jgi:hypothetical protein
VSLADLDAYREEQGVSLADDEAIAALFAEWLARITGATVRYRVVEEHEEGTERTYRPGENWALSGLFTPARGVLRGRALDSPMRR